MIALWALWHGHRDWLRTVELAIVHPGDSDSTGAIVGGFLGCRGVMLPEKLQGRVDSLGVIQRLIARYPPQVLNSV
jgi:ADP-ribosylglycohydrolase